MLFRMSFGRYEDARLDRSRVDAPAELLLMDEPFAALDEMTRFRLNDDLQALRRRLGCTVVFVTHSVFESVYLSDRVALMSPRPGSLVAEVPIDGPALRNVDYRTSPAYARACREISLILAAGWRDGCNR